ncbi:MAG: 50S ribosomal protein L3 [Gemmataceae bacterium]
MPLGMIGQKVGMTQVFDGDGKALPVTVLLVGPCPVLQVRDQGRDGYDAVQLGFLDKPRNKAIRAERGHVAGDFVSKRKTARAAAGVALPPKPNCEPQKHVKEYRLKTPDANLTVGKILACADVFKDVKAVDVIATSKGRGFTGVMKRHNYKGLRASHGVKKGSRQRGSMASNASNRGSGRPKKGIRMAGQYGNTQVTARNLALVRIDPENNLVIVMGAVPGPNGGLISIRPTNKVKSRHGKAKVVLKESAAKKAAAAKKKK